MYLRNVTMSVQHYLFGVVIKTTAYHFGQYEPSSPSTKELHGYAKVRLVLATTRDWIGISCCVRIMHKMDEAPSRYGHH